MGITYKPIAVTVQFWCHFLTGLKAINEDNAARTWNQGCVRFWVRHKGCNVPSCVTGGVGHTMQGRWPTPPEAMIAYHIGNGHDLPMEE